ncbi:Imidazolonepropionase [Streptoalloteichus tenebrarius]|uniref:Imidazolonepropionase n=1 Tax=Streptoalloteichus tenebrarius (strain ATCC 17920 / DSM 40477 / JCM 4838 / CBS 697.72 / NBRC 16177 / NCIMB 11028 / NRRL B-12390 / A12253. 1 / ISP 5477) TaxID=1933 RepID=A0ABT1HLJ0_STRSD|nr:amidohydrolase family protein [Streptoalloteichus tenebrarius]MCP2256359.1 Imidazolonepropionase [Streptoalloteichus tenebrarius]BFF04699.1 amidohydrolase family protein [Streptoalloteichus tenebrarius]
MHRIHADLLIPGAGEPVANGVVVLDGDRIAFAGPEAEAPAAGPDDDTVRVPVVMPGLWDCHTHFAGLPGSVSTQNLMLTRSEVAVARSVRDAEVALLAGFTSVREMSGYGIFLAPVIDEGTLTGPSIYSAGRLISQTGGHADAHSLPYEWVTDPRRANGMLHVADGVPECLRAVRLQLRMGAKLIKVCTSGGVISELDHPRHPQYSDAELEAIVEEAARADRIVAAHCHGKAGIMAALRAGCRTIEHGTEVDEEVVDAMKECDAILVPTRTAFEAFLASKALLPPDARGKLEEIADRHREAMALACSAGVRVAMGTDLGTSSHSSPLGWGHNGEEFAHLVAAGLTPLQAIEAGTAAAPLTLGPQAPRSGLLAEGYDADVIALSANPLDDITVLARPDDVTHVWKRGAPVKSPA